MFVIIHFQDPLPLEKCIIYCEPEWEDFFEIHEFVSKESFVFKVKNECCCCCFPHKNKMGKKIKFNFQNLGRGLRPRPHVVPDPAVLHPEPWRLAEEEEGAGKYHG